MGLQDLLDERETFITRIAVAHAQIQDAVELISDAFLDGKKLLIFGNGGSAADAQHMAAEFVGRFHPPEIVGKWVRRGLPAIALTTDTSAITAIANDWSYDYVFRRQLEALGQPGDVALGITTSGASSNVLEALAHAKTMGLGTIIIVGTDQKLPVNRDIVIALGPGRTPIVQERMLAVEHIICELVEERLRPLGVL